MRKYVFMLFFLASLMLCSCSSVSEPNAADSDSSPSPSPRISMETAPQTPQQAEQETAPVIDLSQYSAIRFSTPRTEVETLIGNGEELFAYEGDNVCYLYDLEDVRIGLIYTNDMVTGKYIADKNAAYGEDLLYYHFDDPAFWEIYEPYDGLFDMESLTIDKVTQLLGTPKKVHMVGVDTKWDKEWNIPSGVIRVDEQGEYHEYAPSLIGGKTLAEGKDKMLTYSGFVGEVSEYWGLLFTYSMGAKTIMDVKEDADNLNVLKDGMSIEEVRSLLGNQGLITSDYTSNEDEQQANLSLVWKNSGGFFITNFRDRLLYGSEQIESVPINTTAEFINKWRNYARKAIFDLPEIDYAFLVLDVHPGVTYTNYNLLRVGMSLSKVTAILGPGKLTSEQKSSSGRYEYYKWTADNGGVITIQFYNGSASNISQYGLV